MRRMLILCALVALAGCGKNERAAQSFVEINEATQAQLQGASVPQTARAMRAHALVGLKTLGYELSEGEVQWLNDQSPQ